MREASERRGDSDAARVGEKGACARRRARVLGVGPGMAHMSVGCVPGPGICLVERRTDRRGSMGDSGKTRSSLLRRVVACVCCLLLGVAVARGTWFVHAVQRGARVVIPAPASESDPLRCTCENSSYTPNPLFRKRL